jgi:CubicO group peptidase (beta-lactamase class C family)
MKKLLLVVTLLAVVSSEAFSQRKSDPLAGLDGYITQAMKDWNVPGLGVAVVRNDSVVYLKGFGVKELGKPDPVTPNTLFAIGSNTKSFTAAATGMLVDDGRIKWDDKVTKYLPSFQLFDPYVSREITIRDVLSHRSGLGRRGDMLWIAAQYPRAEIIRRVRFLEPNAGFRTEMGYQNIMFLTAGEAAAAAAGLTWDELITRRIFQPLGMATSTTTARDLPQRTDVAAPHGMRDSVLKPIPHRNLDNIAPAGSIYSSVAEMTRYLRFILGGGTFEGKQLLKPQTLAVIQTPHVMMPVMRDSLRPSTHFTGYALGWVVLDYKGRKIAWHNGGIDGFLSEMWTVPEEKLGIMVLSNSDNHQMGPGIVSRILDLHMGPAQHDWNAINLKRWGQIRTAQQAQAKRIESERKTDTRPSLALESYAGTYADSLYGELKVKLENGSLVADYGAGNFGGTLEHWQYDSFRATWRDAQFGKGFVTFVIDREGKAAEVRVDNLATFKRK